MSKFCPAHWDAIGAQPYNAHIQLNEKDSEKKLEFQIFSISDLVGLVDRIIFVRKFSG